MASTKERKQETPVRKGRGPSPAGPNAKEGGIALRAGEYEDALRAFDDALALDPKHPYSLYGAAWALTKLVEASPEDARAQRILPLAERLLDVTPPHAHWEGVADEELPRKAIAFALATRASMRAARGKGAKDFQAALGFIDKALAMTRPTDDADSQRAYAETRARVLVKLGKVDEAR